MKTTDHKKTARLIGGILLVVGTSIGGAMLALPVTTTVGGLLPTIVSLLVVWALMTFCAFILLEANLRCPPGSNIITMASNTLGLYGQLFVWIIYLSLLYTLLSAYTASGVDILSGLVGLIGVQLHIAQLAVLFVLVLGAIVCCGIRSIDLINRILMLIKFIALITLMSAIAPHIDPTFLQPMSFHKELAALTVIITSFGFATVIPSLRDYYDSDVKKLRKILWIGSLIPLVIYSIWITVVFGIIPSEGSSGLIAIGQSQFPITNLLYALIAATQSSIIVLSAKWFMAICVVTSFLGVSLCLSDFLYDGLKRHYINLNKIWVYLLTFLPPLVLVVYAPGIFIAGISYAGILVMLLLAWLPLLMVWSGRYCARSKSNKSNYQVFGGKFTLVLALLLTAVITAQTIYLAYH